jgi:hypothetical protein
MKHDIYVGRTYSHAMFWDQTPAVGNIIVLDGGSCLEVQQVMIIIKGMAPEFDKKILICKRVRNPLED